MLKAQKIFMSFIRSNKQFIIFILLMSVFRSAVADWYTVPSGSMKPTIQEGDRIVVNKMAYDLRLPFTDISLFSINSPARGEIVVFESDAANLRLIKRVVGLPGDTISMHNEHLTINGEAIPYIQSTLSSYSLQPNDLFTEVLGEISHSVNINNAAESPLANFSAITIPKGYYLVLGDNRRNSADSRVYGLVPHKELKGKATAVAFSFNYNNFYIPRADRFFTDIYTL